WTGKPWTGKTRPSFELTDSAGAKFALESARGHLVLVHFFATWCEPCREELPALNRLAARSQGTLKVLAISVAEVDPRVRRFLETMPLDFPVLLDRDRAVAKAWEVSTLPTTFVLDAKLRPRLVVETDFAWDGVDPGKLIGILAVRAGGHTLISNQTTTKPKQGGG
ncbi:MAG: TlpA disulfide reductase family protein, partial [Hyphomicrobium sp.]|nr:TlpA disulfide reductase family protein [Hyphomicrobium sp.]